MVTLLELYEKSRQPRCYVGFRADTRKKIMAPHNPPKRTTMIAWLKRMKAHGQECGVSHLTRLQQ